MKKTLSYALFLTLVSSYPLIGEESSSQPEPAPQAPLEHFIAGERAPSLFEKMAYKEMLAQEEDLSQGEENEREPEDVLEEENSLLERQAESYPIPIDFFVYPGYHHFTNYFSTDLSSLELNDGSQWMIAHSDRFIAARWASDERVAIYPNSDWFSLYDYKLLNLQRSEVIRTSLGEMGPFIGGPHTLYLVAFDRYQRTLYLSDGSIWEIASGSNLARVAKWLLSDCIIVGLNNSYWTADNYPAILINFATTDFAVAKRK